MPNNELPQRVPFIGPPGTYTGTPAEIVERFAVAVQEWADRAAHTESSRCRGTDSPGVGRTTGEVL